MTQIEIKEQLDTATGKVLVLFGKIFVWSVITGFTAIHVIDNVQKAGIEQGKMQTLQKLLENQQSSILH